MMNDHGGNVQDQWQVDALAGQHQVEGTHPDLLSYTDGEWSFEDNFLRFMNQAGYPSINDGSETFPWLAQ